MNALVMEEFKALQDDINALDLCAAPNGYRNMRLVIRRLIGYMTVPLVQNLIHHIMEPAIEARSNYVELYALSILPRVEACNPTAFQAMLDMFVKSGFDAQTQEKQEKAVLLVQSVLPCLQVTCNQVGDYRSGLVERCDDTAEASTMMAGYLAGTDVLGYSRIDRDVLQVGILLKAGANEAAEDLYDWGYNAFVSTSEVITLGELATDPDRASVAGQFDLFTKYYGNDTSYGNTMMRKIFQKSEEPFKSASTNQLAELGMGTLKYVVMYMSVLQKLFQAVETCTAGGNNALAQSTRLWDEGVAFYVGSMEGSAEGGTVEGGQLLFSTARETCIYFGQCTDVQQLQAQVNMEIMSAITSVSLELTSTSECEQAQQKLEEVIVPNLQIPLIQGTLLYATKAEKLPAGTSNGDLGASHAFSRSILPLVATVSTTSADVIDGAMKFQLDTKPVPDAVRVFDALADSLPGMEPNCSDIGIFDNDEVSGGVCTDDFLGSSPPHTALPQTSSPTAAPSSGTSAPTLGTSSPVAIPIETGPTPAPQPATSDDLAFGRYTFKTNIDSVARISWDVRDMLAATTVDEARAIYEDGGNSVIERPGSKGHTTVSLQQLSTTADHYMKDDPLFNLFRWALVDEIVFSDLDNDGSQFTNDAAYADRVTEAAFNITGDIALATESTIVLHMWMEVSHHLNDAIRFCQASSSSAVQSIDRAVALWIGESQVEGSFTEGFTLYNRFQQAAKHWGQADEGEASVNTQLMEQFNTAQVAGDLCVDTPDTFKKLRVISTQITRLMIIPLLQEFFYHMEALQENEIELYTVAVVPLSIGCGESVYDVLTEHLQTTKDFEESDIDDAFVEALMTLQQCYQVTCDDLLDGVNPSINLNDFVARVCYDDTSNDRKALAGFQPEYDVQQLSRLDLDILQIGIFVITGAFPAALDYYVNGHNSLNTDGTLRSLSSVATSADRGIAGEHFQVFSDYFTRPDYADQIVLGILRKQGHFRDANNDQCAEAVLRTLQCQVTYMAVLEAMYTSVSRCGDPEQDDGVESWEKAVAMFVGSIEGPTRGGRAIGDGATLYGVGKELCFEFGTCEGSGDASVNEELINYFWDGRNLLEKFDCEGTQKLIEDKIISALPRAVIQASLYYAANNPLLKIGTDSPDLASGAAFVDAILPLVKKANATSEQIISSNMGFDLAKQPVPGGKDAVWDAFRFALPGMGVDCRDLGTLDDETVCFPGSTGGSGGGGGSTGGNTNSTSEGTNSTSGGGGDDDDDAEIVIRPDVETPTELADGLYTTTTYVKDRANIALDVVEIRNALEDSSDANLAKLLYETGSKSEIYNENGIKIGRRSFRSFSTQATLDMTEEPVFNIFMHALSSNDGKYMGKSSREYANTVVMSYFDSTDAAKRALIPEAIVVLNLWMYLAHELFETLSNCRMNVIKDKDGIHSIDEAVAYWVGDGQITGSGDNGHLLYALAERLGEKFDLDAGGQTRTNSNILRLFNQAQQELSFPNACSETSSTYASLRSLVNRIISQMTIPLVQGLIDALRQNDRNKVGMYAHAFVPLVSACDPSLYVFLQDKLLSLTYNVVEVETIVERIRTAYDCLGITCEDVGKHPDETDGCTNTPKTNSLASYSPSADVRSYAMLDLDILEASILLQREAYDAVADLYVHGKHARIDGINGEETVSLARLATTSERTIVPQFDSFTRHFEDANYADKIILAALSPTDPTYQLASPGQRREIVMKTMSYMVLYMGALQQMYEAVSNCGTEDPTKSFDAPSAWDRGAALIIGSLEGTEAGGTIDGQSFFALARKRCEQFGTCDPSGNAIVNDIMVTLLYTGRGEVQAGSCKALRRTVVEVEELMLVPLIQGSLRYALLNEKLPVGSTDGDLAEGYIFSRSVLPLIEDEDREAGATIGTNLDFQLNEKPVKDGARAVFSAFASVYDDLNVDCQLVGAAGNIDACSGASYSGGGGLGAGAIVGIILAVLVAMGIVLFVFYRRKKANKTEETQSFVPNRNGELNHGSDILESKYNDADVVYHDEEVLENGVNGGLSEQARPKYNFT